MMHGIKTLLLLRHGKSSWKDASLRDFDRPLKKRGKQAAEAMGRELLRRGLRLDLLLSSAARRAQQTAKRVGRSTGYSGVIVTEQALYFSGVRRHLDVVAHIDATCGCVLLVGHNPDLEDLVEYLTGDAVVLPTAGLVGIDLAIDSWSAVAKTAGTLLFGVTPKTLTHH